MPENGTIPRTCEQCGTQFLARAGNVSRGYGKFCSRSCMGAYQRRLSGSDTNAFRGGRVTIGGYLYVTIEDDSPFVSMCSNAKYVALHRLRVAEHLGRPLASNEIVHHLNGVKTDNRLENLWLLDRSAHMSIHASGRKITQWTRKHACCVRCGTTERKHSGRGLCTRCYWHDTHRHAKG